MEFEKAKLTDRLALIHMQDLTNCGGKKRPRRAALFLSGYFIGMAVGSILTGVVIYAKIV